MERSNNILDMYNLWHHHDPKYDALRFIPYVQSSTWKQIIITYVFRYVLFVHWAKWLLKRKNKVYLSWLKRIWYKKYEIKYIIWVIVK